MFNFTSCKRKANQNHSVIPPHSFRMTIINNSRNGVGEDMDKTEPSYTAGGILNWYSHCGKQYGGSLQN